jgi:hypothetical protein
MLVLHARLPPDEGAVVVRALLAALEAGSGADAPAEAREEGQREGEPDVSAEARRADQEEDDPDGPSEAPVSGWEDEPDASAETWLAEQDEAQDASAEAREEEPEGEPEQEAPDVFAKAWETAEDGQPRKEEGRGPGSFPSTSRGPVPSLLSGSGEGLASALELLARAAIGQGLSAFASEPPGRQVPALVVVHVDHDVLANPEAPGRCELQGGIGIPPETARRMACEAPVLQTVELSREEGRDCSGEGSCSGEGQTCKLRLGRRQRRVSAALGRALKQRDRGCRFPGCTHRRFLHAHHVKHWAEGGTTDLSNLVLLCSTHHRAVHEGGFRVEAGEGGGLEVYAPSGFRLREVPAPPDLPDGMGATLEREHEEQGLEIDEGTAQCTWDGRPMDFGWALELLMQSDGLMD